jgi:glutathione S-transferase
LPLWFGMTPDGKPCSDEVKQANDLACVPYGEAVRAARDGKLTGAAWESPDGLFAQMLLCDQFSRMAFRGSGEAFASDAQANAFRARYLAAAGFTHLHMAPCVFLLTVGEHSEHLPDHEVNETILAHVQTLVSEGDFFYGMLAEAVAHHKGIVARFGRYPHRNWALNRVSTADEAAWTADYDQLPGFAKSQLPAPTLTLYADPMSENAHRVKVYLDMKGIAYHYKKVELMKGEHKAPEFLKLNPRGQLPCLVDGDVCIAESVAILLYLEAHYPGSRGLSLLPTADKEAHALCLMRTIQMCAKLDPLNFYGGPLFRGETKEQMRGKLDARLAEWAKWDAHLAHQPFLAGEQVSIADIAVLVLAATDAEFGLNLDEAKSPVFKHLAAWFTRLHAEPAVKNNMAQMRPIWNKMLQDKGYGTACDFLSQ